ncbi:MAG: carboxypeptidase regulatory-like domain-containing protein, partial [Micromonosporaceae bacterium]
SGGPSAGDVIQGQGQITVGATEQDLNRENNAAAYAVNLAGPAEPVGVTSVSGEVVDSESDKPVRGARVVVTDGADRKRTARTNNSGRFKVQGSTDSPIEPGSIKVVVTKKGYERKSYQTTSDDGEAVKANLYLLKKAKKSPSASATEKSAEPAAGPADDAGAGWGMWVLGILGTLLVLGGIGALLYPFINRRGEDDDEADAYGHAMRPGHAGHAGYGDQPTAVYGAARSGGINEPTSVYGAARSGGINEPTAMYGAARSGGVDQPTSMINQPTSMIRPPEQRTGSQSPPAAAGGRHGRNEDNPGYGGDPGYSNDLGYPSRGEPGSYSTPPGSYGQPGGSDVRGQSYGRHSHREVGDQGGGRHSGPSGVGQDPATDDQPRRPSPRRDRQLDWYDE